jgi:hypothetical protein
VTGRAHIKDKPALDGGNWKARNPIVLGLCLLLAQPLLADFRYDETTAITGGSIVGTMKFAGAFSKDAKQALQPTTSTVLVKGNRMARINPERTEIVDLDKETITRIDHRTRQYSVLTFQQMKQQMEEARRRAQEEQAKRQPAPPPQGTNPPPPQMNFKVNVRNTDATKVVAGLDTKESILTMALEATDRQSGQTGALAITNDMWMAPEIPGYGEVRDFNRKLALKMGPIFADAFRPALASMPSGSAQGMAEMVKETSKLSGVPVMQVMRMGSTANGQPLPAASESPLPPSNGPATPGAGEVAKESATSAIAGKLGLGGLGGFGRKKKQEQPAEQPPQDQSQTNPNATQSVLLESSVELKSFSSAPIDAGQFSVPEGYSEVPADLNRSR